MAFAKEGLLVVVVEEEGPVEKIDGLALVVVHTYTILTWPSTVFFFLVSLHPKLPEKIFGLLTKVRFLMMKTTLVKFSF